MKSDIWYHNNLAQQMHTQFPTSI